HEGDGVALPRVADGLQRADLRRRLQAIAALDLRGGGAAEQHLVEARAQKGHERAAIRGARGRDRAHDPAPGGRDLLVARARQPLADLAVVVTREREVGMRVDESGQDHRAVRVEDRRVRRNLVRPQEGFGTDVGDPPVLSDDGGRRDFAHATELGAQAGTPAGRGNQAPDVADDEVARHRAREARRSSARAPAKSSTLSRVFAPCVTETAEGGSPRWRARKRTRAALAWPSTGGAVRRTTRAPPRSPASSSRDARGDTRTRRVAPPATSRISIIGVSARCEREPLLRLLAPLEE